ncbi:beta-N-acetylhexosaminidase [Rhodobacteraceae bacterium RKSG542]|uniref:beta-N-acetylhexosaminidase n=1 Tax=Pseudovibrio flavus TaxID=2529854 RepID=UPI0012BC0B20|nr:family 20 glycosylhydrolase [Pseudovibrio flavus]MTI17976.1 beta-N-acetylhexosaminidase [Pseudovibrio flavus]
MASGLILENVWHPLGDDVFGKISFALHNFSDDVLTDFKLVYTCLTRTVESPICTNATYLRRVANFHELSTPADFSLKQGETWRFEVEGFLRAAVHRTDGAKSAYVTTADGKHIPASVGDLLLDGYEASKVPPLLAEGHLERPFYMQPWPANAELVPAKTCPPIISATESASTEERAAMLTINQLQQRLFPEAQDAFTATPVSGARLLRFSKTQAQQPSGYQLTFNEADVLLEYNDKAGLNYGLTTIAQLHHGAKLDAAKFSFPAVGIIKDEPRYSWRGCHLDVSRQFYPKDDIKRILDILAWLKMNVFHWHLNDDESWRLEVKAYPELTEIGATRSPDGPLLPQLGNGAEPASGHYTHDDVREIVSHGAKLCVDILPEIDLPGHCTATLAAIQELSDGQEAPDSYRSVQGYPNNAINPAMEETYIFLDKLFDELVSLFPFRYIHVGGDEVSENAWLHSPRARALMEREGLKNTFDLQAYFLKRVQDMLHQRGKRLAGWEEVSLGTGVSREDTLLFPWQAPEVGINLAEQGYDVVMAPGQAYYLDMAQSDDWYEPGASWAGTVPPEHTYTYEPEGDFPEELRPRMKGVQACIWCEHFLTRAYFNRLVFPRLCAIAEAGWTPKENKSWQRFSALAPYTPKL